jgi:hypothetical protein
MAEEVLAQKLNIKAHSQLSQSADPTTQATHPLIRISEALNLPNFPLLHQYSATPVLSPAHVLLSSPFHVTTTVLPENNQFKSLNHTIHQATPHFYLGRKKNRMDCSGLKEGE